jgi:hypothetical protein
MQLSATLIVLVLATSILGAPLPTQQLDKRASDLESREPVHWMNIQLHRLEEDPESDPDSQHAMNIMKHREWLPEDESEFEQRDFDKHDFRIGVVY